MLETDLINDKIISIDVNLALNAKHSFSITLFKAQAADYRRREIGIYRDNVLILNGVVTSQSYNAAIRQLTITGQDRNSYICERDATPDSAKTLSAATATTLPAAIQTIKSNAVRSCPAVPCYGYGSYSGSTHAFIERIANSFGLNYISDPVGTGYYLSPADLAEPETFSVRGAFGLAESSDAKSVISKVFVQKAITQAQFQQIEVKNTAVSSTELVRLINPNAVSSGDPSKQFPKDYYLDPWTKSFVTIDVPAVNTVYKTATQIAPAQQVKYISNNDTITDPPWRLEVWQGDPGVGDLPNPGAVKQAYLTAGQTWTAGPNEQATHLRIAHDIQDGGASITDYPHYDGVAITAHVWQTAPSSAITPWHGEYLSGDSSGRPDYNVISEEMYPNKSAFAAAGVGTWIAKRDSLNLQRSFVLPKTPDFDLLDSVAVITGGHAYPIPITSMQLRNAAGVEQTQVKGEW